jgi:pyruvate dehydrogenase E1 component beta subunit
MRRDDRVFIIGEEIYGGPGGFKGAFKVTEGLVDEFSDRLLDTPICEQTIMGAALGAAMTGLRPVAEIMYEDFITLAMDQLVNSAASTYYMSGGEYHAPMVVRSTCGSLGTHPHTWTSWFMHIPGLYVVFPSNAYDAKGLLKSAIRDDNPVLFLEHRKLYNVSGMVPEEEYLIPMGQAKTVIPGEDISVLAVGHMVHFATTIAEEMIEQGVSLEVIDLRCVAPLDLKVIVESVKKTHKAIVIAEDWKTAGPTSEIAALISEQCFDYLDAPVTRVGARDTFIPHNLGMRNYVMPGVERIKKAVEGVLSW